MIRITTDNDGLAYYGKISQEIVDEEGNKKEVQIEGITKAVITLLPSEVEVVLTIKRAHISVIVDKAYFIPYDYPRYPRFKQKVINFFKNLFKKKVKPVQAWKPRER